MRRQDATTAESGTRRSWVRRIAALMLFLLVCAGVVTAELVYLTPSVDDAERRTQAITRAHGTDESERAAPRFAAALIATEDAGFRDHHGVDAIGVARYTVTKVTGGGEAAGSTLNQQLAKQLYYGGEAEGIRDKIAQLTLGAKLDARYAKEEILRMYSSVAYFGHGYYGVESASEGYFGVRPDQLNWGQAALLAGLVQAPAAYDPYERPDLAQQRKEHVLSRLVETGRLSPAEAREAARESRVG